MGLLNGKNALITGGSRGIGEAVVRKFIEQGANVAFTYRSSSSASDAIVAELSTSDNKIIAYQSDAANFQDTQDTVAKILEDFGSIDILINNAGITQDNLHA